MQKLFIDANIYLDYFRQSPETLGSLKRLKRLLSTRRKLILVIPQQTKDEYLRNRAMLIEQTRTILDEQSKFALKLPPVIRDWRESKRTVSQIGKLRQGYRKILTKYDKTTGERKTEVDGLIEDLFALGESYEESESILQKAHTRYMKGNPPRKNDHSYGDAIIWELLLERASDSPLVIVTRDGDFKERRGGVEVIKSFLDEEWHKKTNKKLKLFTSLGEFINAVEEKSIITKEIIAEEKSTPVRAYPLSENTFAPGAIPVSPWGQQSLTDTFQSATVNELYPFSLGGSIYHSLLPKPAKFCPYCGKKINIDRDRESGSYLMGSQNRIKCPHCGGEFTPE